jgi:ubiquinone/menaquinone biosynthesis C-methylase UbiE
MHLVPPERLVAENAIGAGDFVAIGEGIIQGLIERKMFKPDAKILDIGCGLGRLARPLVGFLKGGEYFGLDINRSSIDWCQSNYQPHPNFHFEWIDAFSKSYNPASKVAAAQYEFPFADDTFDFVMLTSVFTHMLLADVDNYLAQIARVMKLDGRCYATYFLLDRRQEKLFKSASQYFPIAGGFITDKEFPEKVVFLCEDRVRALHGIHGLVIKSLGYGSWSGKSSLGYQDEIVAVKSRKKARVHRLWSRLKNRFGGF